MFKLNLTNKNVPSKLETFGVVMNENKKSCLTEVINRINNMSSRDQVTYESYRTVLDKDKGNKKLLNRYLIYKNRSDLWEDITVELNVIVERYNNESDNNTER